MLGLKPEEPSLPMHAHVLLVKVWQRMRQRRLSVHVRFLDFGAYVQKQEVWGQGGGAMFDNLGSWNSFSTD